MCVLHRGLQNLDAPLKGFNCCGAKLRLRCADSRFAEPRSFLQKGRFSYFSRVRKVPKVHQRFANLWTPGTIQIAGRYGVFSKVTGVHQVTGNAENCNFSGIAGNDLNRCDAPALQHKIRAKSKRTTVFFANSRLRAVGRGGGGQKRLLWVAVKKVCAKENLLVCENGRFLKPARKGTCKKKFLCVKNGFE